MSEPLIPRRRDFFRYSAASALAGAPLTGSVLRSRLARAAALNGGHPLAPKPAHFHSAETRSGRFNRPDESPCAVSELVYSHRVNPDSGSLANSDNFMCASFLNNGMLANPYDFLGASW